MLTEWRKNCIKAKEEVRKNEENYSLEMEEAPPATPRHMIFSLWLLPSGPDQVNE